MMVNSISHGYHMLDLKIDDQPGIFDIELDPGRKSGRHARGAGWQAGNRRLGLRADGQVDPRWPGGQHRPGRRIVLRGVGSTPSGTRHGRSSLCRRTAA